MDIAPSSFTPSADLIAQRLYIHGRVQGVGFRPFVYRLAQRFKMVGWVQNCSGEVIIHIQGTAPALDAFQHALIQEAPPLSRPNLADMQTVALEPYTQFTIQTSAPSQEPDIHVPPDGFTCADCLAELQDPSARRYRYPFINCTQCGPRYTIIRALPYDRPNTTLADFSLCQACRDEYQNPYDRRFHAQPLACSQCGPELTFAMGGSDKSNGEQALKDCLEALKAGRIVAVKGVGGYHLLCDATHEPAVQRLRERKHRPAKPLAVMFPQQGVDGLDSLRLYTHPGTAAVQQLQDPMRPIVLVQKRSNTNLAPSLAPGLEELGVFLPYSPLHHLILGDFQKPLVATSGNISGEPVIIDNQQADTGLGKVADGFLHHNRPIQRPADDGVYRVIAGVPRPLRLGRGNAPYETSLAIPVDKPLLALGGHIKVTVALAWGKRVVVSPHIGDLDSPRSVAVFQQVCHDLQQLYGVSAQRLVCDAHPGFASARWAHAQKLPVTRILHHHAHAAAVAGEFPTNRRWLIFAWDGVGFGADGTLWGGETLLGQPGSWQRLASFRPFRIPGGDRAGREPWRSAAALCWETGRQIPQPSVAGLALAHHAWQRNLNCPLTSAAGRLFDAAAALLGIVQCSSFEGQGPMLLETLAGDCDDSVDLPLSSDGADIIRIDWSPLLDVMQDFTLPVAQRAAMFHNSLADCVVGQTLLFRDKVAFDSVGLTGGVFQNRKLAERIIAKLKTVNVEIYLPQRLPCNDGGLSYGQVVEAAALLD